MRESPAPLSPALVLDGGALPLLDLAGPSFLAAGFPLANPLLWAQYALMSGVELAHTAGGLEWWAAVAASSVALRAVTFSALFMRSTRMGAWMQHHAPALAAYTDRLAADRKAGNKEAADATLKEYFAFMKAKDLNLISNIVAPLFIQLVTFASFFTGLRKLAEQAHLVPGLGTAQAVEGTWLLALHLPDPLFVLPVASAALSVAAIAANPNMAGIPQAELTAGGQKVVFGAFATLFNLASAVFPSVRGVEWGRGGGSKNSY